MDHPDLAAMIGSRICHDLISPIGAIGNGMELLTMSGSQLGPEIALISESVSNANARIRFFRIAFGSAKRGQTVARSEILSTLSDMTVGSRLSLRWKVAGDRDRVDVKCAFLALQCMESALPYGGEVTVDADGDGWTIAADAARTMINPECWALLDGSGDASALVPAQVQFALLPRELARDGRRAHVKRSETRISISY
ncbi:MAG: histidine phosphotransferase [Rhodobacteraceae bacterium]|nr:histidine phosphotransferase [Paracoccaceae bacterium]